MRREVPLTIVFISGAFLAFQYSYHICVGQHLSLCPGLDNYNRYFYNGRGNRIALTYIMIGYPNAKKGGYSVVTLAALAFMTILGLLSPNAFRNPVAFHDPVFLCSFADTGYYVCFLAFFIASAAYRAFRAKTLLATLLMLSAVIVMLGRVPIGDMLVGWLPEGMRFSDIARFILDYPNTAAKRAIYIGVGLGVGVTP